MFLKKMTLGGKMNCIKICVVASLVIYGQCSAMYAKNTLLPLYTEEAEQRTLDKTLRARATKKINSATRSMRLIANSGMNVVAGCTTVTGGVVLGGLASVKIVLDYASTPVVYEAIRVSRVDPVLVGLMVGGCLGARIAAPFFRAAKDNFMLAIKKQQ